VAVKENPFSIRYIQNPSERVQLMTVKENPFSIYYIENPSERVQLTAVESKNHSWLSEPGWVKKYIKNPTEKVIQLARSKGY
jgi:hypothetical protein